MIVSFCLSMLSKLCIVDICILSGSHISSSDSIALSRVDHPSVLPCLSWFFCHCQLLTWHSSSRSNSDCNSASLFSWKKLLFWDQLLSAFLAEFFLWMIFRMIWILMICLNQKILIWNLTIWNHFPSWYYSLFSLTSCELYVKRRKTFH